MNQKVIVIIFRLRSRRLQVFSNRSVAKRGNGVLKQICRSFSVSPPPPPPPQAASPAAHGHRICNLNSVDLVFCHNFFYRPGLLSTKNKPYQLSSQITIFIPNMMPQCVLDNEMNKLKCNRLLITCRACCLVLHIIRGGNTLFRGE